MATAKNPSLTVLEGGDDGRDDLRHRFIPRGLAVPGGRRSRICSVRIPPRCSSRKAIWRLARRCSGEYGRLYAQAILDGDPGCRVHLHEHLWRAHSLRGCSTMERKVEGLGAGFCWRSPALLGACASTVKSTWNRWTYRGGKLALPGTIVGHIKHLPLPPVPAQGASPLPGRAFFPVEPLKCRWPSCRSRRGRRTRATWRLDSRLVTGLPGLQRCVEVVGLSKTSEPTGSGHRANDCQQERLPGAHDGPRLHYLGFRGGASVVPSGGRFMSFENPALILPGLASSSRRTR